jgi:CBS domain-containing protein
MSKTMQNSIKVTFIDDIYKIEAVVLLPADLPFHDYLERHKESLPVNEVIHTRLADNEIIGKEKFAYINTKKFHLIVPDKKKVKPRGISALASLEDIMTTKIVVVEPATSVLDAYNLMRRNSIHHLPVLKKKRLVGLVSKSDLGMHIWQDHDDPVNKYMKTKIYTASYNDTFQDAMMEMVDKNITCLPVLNGKTVVGIISQKDIFKFIYRDIFSKTLR